MNMVRVQVRGKGTSLPYSLEEAVTPAPDDTVIIRRENDTLYGVVSGAPYTPPESLSCCQSPKGTAMRVATETDLEQVDALIRKEQEAAHFCQERADALGLSMQVLEVEGVLSGNQVTCFFSAERRVDFRQLVKDVGRRFHCHVLMRQVSQREEAQRSCGAGPCGRTLCCASFLSKPRTVTSQEARESAPGVSHSKLTGVCGKLMCCLAFDGPQEKQTVNAA